MRNCKVRRYTSKNFRRGYDDRSAGRSPRIRACSFTTVLASVFLYVAAHAQEQLAFNPEQALARALEDVRARGLTLPQEQIDEMYAVVRNSPLPPRNDGPAWFREMMEAGNNPYEAPVVSKFVGKQGVPFPKYEEIVQRPPPGVNDATEETVTPEPEQQPTPYRTSTRCEKNETRKSPTPSGSGSEKLVADTLFIPASLVPLDPDEVLGPRVSLTTYEDKENDPGLYRASLIKAPCVPYRIRVTNLAVYYDTGSNALRNYAGNQSGSGILHPVMQEKLFGSQGGASRGKSAQRRR